MTRYVDSEMSVSVVPAGSVPPDLLTTWTRIILDAPGLSSPFFSPAFVGTVASVIPDVYVGVLRRGGRAVAFLPFERNRLGVGKRLRMSDYQGVIAEPGLSLDPRELIKACGLRAWDFDHLLASQEMFQDYHIHTVPSAVMDVSDGFDSYMAGRRAAEKQESRKWARRLRKLEREMGAVCFDAHVPSQSILDAMLRWKIGKYSKHVRSYYDSMKGILVELLDVQDTQCRGTLSVLRAGDSLVAATFGLRSETAWHSLVTAYNPDFRNLSPGIILKLKMAESAPPMGINHIDLGIGEEEHKKRLSNKTIAVAQGSVNVSPLLLGMRCMGRVTKEQLRRIPGLQRSARIFRPMVDKWIFRPLNRQ